MMSQKEMTEKALEMMRSFHTAMLVTHAADNTLVSRPMGIAQVDDDCTISFVTTAGSEKVDEALHNSAVAVTMQSGQAFVAVSGQASVILDPEEKERVWGLMSNIWYDGPQDESAVVMQIRPDVIEYWDNRGINGLRFTVQAVRALITGESPHPTREQHGVVTP